MILNKNANIGEFGYIEHLTFDLKMTYYFIIKGLLN